MAKSRNVEINPHVHGDLQIYKSIKHDQAQLKATELNWRSFLIANIPFDPDKTEGSQTVNIDGIGKLKLDRPVSYTLASDQQTVMDCLARLHALNPYATLDLVRWKPELSTEAYRKLTEEERRILASILIIKPGLPALTFGDEDE